MALIRVYECLGKENLATFLLGLDRWSCFFFVFPVVVVLYFSKGWFMIQNIMVVEASTVCA